jgi:hypothetical protein
VQDDQPSPGRRDPRSNGPSVVGRLDLPTAGSPQRSVISTRSAEDGHSGSSPLRSAHGRVLAPRRSTPAPAYRPATREVVAERGAAMILRPGERRPVVARPTGGGARCRRRGRGRGDAGPRPRLARGAGAAGGPPAAGPDRDRRALLRAHGAIASWVRPAHAVEDMQPASRTLARGYGSCSSQRPAVPEAVACPPDGEPIRNQLVDGRPWCPRFPRLRCAVPGARCSRGRDDLFARHGQTPSWGAPEGRRPGPEPPVGRRLHRVA